MDSLLPLKYVPRKNSMMTDDRDAVYYTDMLYPVYGREIILITQSACRHFTHSAFDLRFQSLNGNKEKEVAYLIEEVQRRLSKKNVILMMQANLDVYNGKLTIEEARLKTEDEIETHNALLPPLAKSQIKHDVANGKKRDMSEYLDYSLLEAERAKFHEAV
jgi:hypothetical protein